MEHMFPLGLSKASHNIFLMIFLLFICLRSCLNHCDAIFFNVIFTLLYFLVYKVEDYWSSQLVSQQQI